MNTPKLSRRTLLLNAAAAVSLGFGGLRTYAGAATNGTPARMAEGYGPLVSDPEGLLHLPKGFSYKILARKGDLMSDGFRVPGSPDGMAAFEAPGGKTAIVCNHELNFDAHEDGPFAGRSDDLPFGACFDRGETRPCPGGTTTFIYDTTTQRVERHYLSLTGTVRNCAGGPTPWHSWITCEETVDLAGEGRLMDHGWNFEVPALGGLVEQPLPLKAMGRFNHEAIAVDPASGAIYQTEDRDDGLLYRFLPSVPGRLEQGGRLQALAFRGEPSRDSRNWGDGAPVKPGEMHEVEWIDCEGIESPDDDLRLRMFDKGAARFARGEGMWYGRDAVFFACTNGGEAREGQIWRYVPSPLEGRPGEVDLPGRLELFIEPNDAKLVDNADNLTVSPWGDLIVCEDGDDEQAIVGVTPEGGLYRFGLHPGGSEFAGACFSPDGSTLFVNIQHVGLTLAITGPWQG